MNWSKLPSGIKAIFAFLIFALIIAVIENNFNGWAGLAVFTWLYFLPYLIATKRHLKDAPSIGVINLFLGWTLIGWVLSLAKAVSGTAERYETLENIVTPSQASPFIDKKIVNIFWEKHRPWIVTIGTLLFVFIAAILSNKEQTASTPTSGQENTSAYSLPHNAPLTADDADIWYRACLGNTIRTGLQNKGRFDWRVDEHGSSPAARVLNMACTAEYLDWLKISCEPRFGPDRCIDMFDDEPLAEYTTITKYENESAH